jgi:hypothetical protein
MENQNLPTDNVVHSYYHSSWITIKGFRSTIEPVLHSHIEEVVNSMVNNIEISEIREATKSALENKIIEHIKTKKSTPNEMLNMEIKYSFYSGNSDDARKHRNIPFKYFEKDYKTYADKQEIEEWLPRINMIDICQETNLIYALSIVPYNPDIEQTWYYKKSFYLVEAIPENASYLEKMFGGYVPSRKGTSTSGIRYNTYSEKITTNNKNPE